MDFLSLEERIKLNLQLRESQFREFKSAYEGKPGNRVARDAREIAYDIGKTLVGFANADGGELIVGVEDDASISGVPHAPKTIEQFLNAPKTYIHSDTPLPSSLLTEKILVEGKLILYFYVEKSTTFIHLTSDGKCLQRKDRETVPVSVEKLKFERREQISREYDRQFVDGAKVQDLDIDLLVELSNQITRGISPEKLLQYFELAEPDINGLRLRRAALLLFGKNIGIWHPRSSVRIVRVRGNELLTGRDYNAISDEIETDNIITLLKTAWIKIRPHLTETRFHEDGLFKENTMYPEDAVFETLLNALAHRDYSIEGRGIEIYIFDNRMEIQSPGGILSTVTIEEIKKLTGAHQSRNSKITKVLVELGFMREMGEGMRRIFKLMKERDLVAPELIGNQNLFNVILKHDSVFSSNDQRWLNGFRDLKLSRDEMLVALLGKEGNLISRQNIIDTLDLTDTADYTTITYNMQVKGLLYRAVPKKKSKRGGASARKIPVYGIREPQQCESSLSELYALISHIGPITSQHYDYISELFNKLSPNNIFKSDTTKFRKFLSVIGLFNEHKEPTELLEGIWKSNITNQNSNALFKDSKTTYSHKGKILWYNHKKSYGFISTQSEDIFFHKSNLSCSVKEIVPGIQVSFEVEHAPKGLIAQNIILI